MQTEERRMPKYIVWQGGFATDERVDEEERSARDEATAAEGHACYFDTGEDGAVVYVLNDAGEIHEFDGTFRRSVTCDMRSTRMRLASEVDAEFDDL
jgi:hypothetical protein